MMARSRTLTETSDVLDFDPPVLLRSPHVQTVLSSRLGGRASAEALETSAETLTLTCSRGVRLLAVLNSPRETAPLVILIHGWLGQADSPYLTRAARVLAEAGFSVARLLLRDHGGTAALNAGMFNSARIDEVVEACNLLIEHAGAHSAGLMGFSLGGNFALRVGCDPHRDPRLRAVLAICPVVDPARSVGKLDTGWIGYRWYFLRKWRRALKEKQAAFPTRYDVDDALTLPTIGALTNYFVERYTPYRDSDDYYARYTLTNATFEDIDIPMQIVAAADDPVIPVSTVHAIESRDLLGVSVTRFGGHCAYIGGFGGESVLGSHARRYFLARLPVQP